MVAAAMKDVVGTTVAAPRRLIRAKGRKSMKEEAQAAQEPFIRLTRDREPEQANELEDTALEAIGADYGCCADHGCCGDEGCCADIGCCGE